MKIRTQLTASFVVLAVLPIAAIVAYHYLTSTATLREATEREARQLASQIDRGLEAAKGDVQRRLERVGGLPFQQIRLGDAADSPEQLMARILDQMGDAASLMESIEFVPRPPSPPAAPPVDGDQPRPIALEGSDADTFWFFVDRDEELPEAEEEQGTAKPKLSMLYPQDWARRHAEMRDRRLEIEKTRLDERVEHLTAKLEQQLEAIERVEVDSEVELARTRSLSAEIERLEQRRDRVQSILGGGFESSVREGDLVVGELRASVNPRLLMRQVLSRIPRDRGEIPFAVDAEGEIYTPRREDYDELNGLRCVGGTPLIELLASQDDTSYESLDDWVVVTQDDEETELVFGIARPIGDSIATMRQTSVRNLGLGLGMLGLAILGILPLSGRVTRRLSHLTDQVERLAAGDLGTRAQVAGRDEVATLGRAFNDMAADLEDQQRRLIDQERENQEQLVNRRLLEAENQRKSLELEEARRFQLSLLPSELPVRDELELAVFMATAAEVGGDYYDFAAGDDGELLLVVGDATGHGARAGTMVTVVKTLFAAMAPSGGRLCDFLEEATGSIKSMNLGRRAMALLVARYKDSRLDFSSAGMPPILVVRARGGQVEEFGLEGVPLGSLAGARYEQSSIDLERGDTMVFMSDGLPELLDEEGEPLGYGAVREELARLGPVAPQEIVDHLGSLVRDRSGEAPSDDVTVLAVRLSA